MGCLIVKALWYVTVCNTGCKTNWQTSDLKFTSTECPPHSRTFTWTTLSWHVMSVVQFTLLQCRPIPIRKLSGLISRWMKFLLWTYSTRPIIYTTNQSLLTIYLLHTTKWHIHTEYLPHTTAAAVIHAFGRVCVSVMFLKLWRINFIFGTNVRVHLQNNLVKFVCEGQCVKVKVTRAKQEDIWL